MLIKYSRFLSDQKKKQKNRKKKKRKQKANKYPLISWILIYTVSFPFTFFRFSKLFIVLFIIKSYSIIVPFT